LVSMHSLSFFDKFSQFIFKRFGIGDELSDWFKKQRMTANLSQPDQYLQHLHVPCSNDAQSVQLVDFGLCWLEYHIVKLPFLGIHF
jgi:hypothetical protein